MAQDIGQIDQRVHFVEFAALDQGIVDGRSAARTFGAYDTTPTLAAKYWRPARAPPESNQINILSTSSTATSSSHRSYSAVVRGDSCAAICCANSRRPPFRKY